MRAESTNKLNITIGIKILSSLGIIEDRELIMETIKTIYRAATNECKNGFFIMLFLFYLKGFSPRMMRIRNRMTAITSRM